MEYCIADGADVNVTDLGKGSVCSGVIVWCCGLSVGCYRPVIRHLDLSGNQLAGSIPDSIGNLTSLGYVVL